MRFQLFKSLLLAGSNKSSSASSFLLQACVLLLISLLLHSPTLASAPASNQEGSAVVPDVADDAQQFTEAVNLRSVREDAPGIQKLQGVHSAWSPGTTYSAW